MDSVVENWSLIGDTYYIKYHFYNMKWEITNSNFKDHIFALESFGGSIAAISKSASNQELMIFSPSGILISSTMWKDAPVIGLFWSENEHVFLLQKSGNVAIYSLHCKYIKYVAMGDTVKQTNVKSFRFFATLQGVGLMVLTEYNELFFKINLMNTDCVIKQIKNSKQCLIDTITDWVAFTDSISKEIVAVFACKNSLIKLKYDQEPQIFNHGCKWHSSNCNISKLAWAEQKLAIALSNGKIWIMNSDLSLSISTCDFDFSISDGDIVQMEWAGEDCIVLYHKDCIYLMDTNHQSTNNMYLDNPLLFPEIDGVRLITATKHEFIQKIPHQLEQLQQFSSESPAMLLFDAQQHLDSKMSEAVNYLELIISNPGKMQEAVDICMAAAAYCLEPKWQKIILRAVRLGRSYIPDYKSDKVEDIHKKLLLLNNLKLPYVAMPITMYQLERMTMGVVLDRLINRHYYPFVERICVHLRIPKDQGINRMLEYWADNYIERKEDEYLLASKILSRLENHTDFDFAKIASRACDLNKFILAEKLLDREGRIQHQVRILLKLKKYTIALTRSIESGDSDLISWVVSELYKNIKYQEFIMMIHKNPIAKTMYLEHLMDSNNQDSDKSKRSFEELDDNLVSKTEVLLQKALKSETAQSALSAINSAQDMFKKTNNEFMVQIMDDEKVLLQNMSTTIRGTELDITMPIHDYLSYLFQHKLYDKAEALKQKLKISDRQFYWSKLNICAKTDNWDEFNSTISKWSRKTPVNYYDIGEICAEYNNELQLSKYMDKIELDKRVRLLVKMDKLQEAEDLAKKLKNEYLIHYVTAYKF